ncbi:DUF599 family protein [Pikeienuella piscinae]|uniref:DUF599 family protein n=1 Tax=Pikeienuella piscinae TaxID=2748098 RepID=A0A7M3T6A1_9RHOB|nr:DUF599 family protein [Pikeienuella piscinae]QIE57532.1 DUF599 family protein [Pikeienuella piscinae]
MTGAHPDWLGPFTLWDGGALLWFMLAFWATGWMVTHHPRAWSSTGELISAYRQLWMRRAARREVRVTDITLLATLRHGASFLASMTVFAIGGAVALLGQIDLLESVAMSVAGGLDAPRAAQQGKTLFLIAVLAYAFLKFVWSLRVFGYCAVVMGAMPGDREGDKEGEIEREAARAAALNRIAARNFNEGLRALYFALALLAWFLGPIALIVATTMTTAMLVRREFGSETRAALRFSSFRGCAAPERLDTKREHQ